MKEEGSTVEPDDEPKVVGYDENSVPLYGNIEDDEAVKDFYDLKGFREAPEFNNLYTTALATHEARSSIIKTEMVWPL